MQHVTRRLLDPAQRQLVCSTQGDLAWGPVCDLWLLVHQDSPRGFGDMIPCEVMEVLLDESDKAQKGPRPKARAAAGLAFTGLALALAAKGGPELISLFACRLMPLRLPEATATAGSPCH